MPPISLIYGKRGSIYAFDADSHFGTCARIGCNQHRPGLRILD